MRRCLASLMLAAGLALTTPALAEETAPSPDQTTPPAKPAKPAKDDPNRMVCTREHVVGSNRPVKVCMTAAEREQLRDQSARAVDETRRAGPQSPGGVQGE